MDLMCSNHNTVKLLTSLHRVSFPMFAILTATHSSGYFCLAAKSGLTLS